MKVTYSITGPRDLLLVFRETAKSSQSGLCFCFDPGKFCYADGVGPALGGAPIPPERAEAARGINAAAEGDAATPEAGAAGPERDAEVEDRVSMAPIQSGRIPVKPPAAPDDAHKLCEMM
jgi:hypothetical protein